MTGTADVLKGAGRSGAHSGKPRVRCKPASRAQPTKRCTASSSSTVQKGQAAAEAMPRRFRKLRVSVTMRSNPEEDLDLFGSKALTTVVEKSVDGGGEGWLASQGRRLSNVNIFAVHREGISSL